MRKSFYFPALSTLCVLIIFCSLIAIAQNREKFVISAKAGGINAVTGQAKVNSKGESDWQQLMVTDDLNAGDRVRTDNDGRVEILLNPGSYLRVGGNSEVELANNSLANVEVRLIRGTAIVEATGADGLELNINISTPHTRLAIVRQGLYRLNVVPGDATELIVRKGRVILNDSHTKVKGGNKVVFSATTVSVAKLTKEENKKQEEVDNWSKERAETLAKANRRISDRMLTSAFSSFNGFDLSGFGFRNSGFWFYNARAGCYTFLPFGFGWGSPYGSSYSTSIYTGATILGRPSPTSTTGSWPTQTGSAGGSNPAPAAVPTGSIQRTNPIGSPASGGMGREPSPRMIDPDTGNRMPRKNIEQPERPN